MRIGADDEGKGKRRGILAGLDVGEFSGKVVTALKEATAAIEANTAATLKLNTNVEELLAELIRRGRP